MGGGVGGGTLKPLPFEPDELQVNCQYRQRRHARESFRKRSPLPQPASWGAKNGCRPPPHILDSNVNQMTVSGCYISGGFTEQQQMVRTPSMSKNAIIPPPQPS